MLFIDPITKLNLKSGQQNEPIKRRTPLPKLLQNEVDISSDAHTVREITLLTDQSHNLLPEDCLIANLLAAVFDTCEKKHTPTIPLQSIKQQNNSEIILQTPPIPNSWNERYSNEMSQAHQKSEEFIATVPVICKNGYSIDFKLYLELGLGSPKRASLFEASLKHIDALPIKTPYEFDYISSLPHELTFIVDQDGEEDQIQKLLDNHNEDSKRHVKYEHAVELRVWLINPNRIVPVILGDAHLGYVYVGNVALNQKRTQAEGTSIEPNSINIEA
ncbi:hypothetical protein [Marinomonas balearica]|uniref:Uncharacterized protein n=1 Tax=Marinomonas balearica TaxID=491947 RepID=A0A4R6MAN6_9GAMM|nr:hypothetical protein [Marinomonas balearica]TDO98145.1 hypothetical protein DFP79_1779 [Marinomonas balearica]